MRQRDEQIGMLNEECPLILDKRAESVNERTCEAISDLQSHAEHHGEEEEKQHPRRLQKSERVKAEPARPGLTILLTVHGATRHGERIEAERDAPDSTNKELHRALLETYEIDRPHGHEEADRPKNADARKVVNLIKARPLHSRIRH